MNESNKDQSPSDFNKYYYYEKSVQNPENEIDFFNEKFSEIRSRKAYILREDFCGTAAISNLWVKQGEDYKAYGIDLDDGPITYGRETHYSKLSEGEKRRMQYIQGDVLSSDSELTDITFAFNFSYFIFKERQKLLEYFRIVHKGLKSDGVFFVDIFGGPDSQTLMTDVIKHKGFKYYWECQKFNPLTNECLFGIHFKRKGEKKRKNIFTYSWRMWTVIEIREIMLEAGFKDTITYWEREDEDGEGNGEFYKTESAQNCDAWVTYIAALK